MRSPHGKIHVHSKHAARALHTTEHVVISFDTMMSTESDEEILSASQEIEVLTAVLGPETVHNADFPHYSDISDDEYEENVARTDHEGEVRFKFISSDTDIKDRAHTAVPKNTRRRNKWALNTYSTWAIWRNNNRLNEMKITNTLDKMDTSEVTFWLSRFVLEVRKKNGELYPPSSLVSLVMGLQSHIRLTCKRDLDILNSPEFEEFRQVFDGELKRITNTGLGQKKKQAEPIRDDEENQLWKLKLLGGYNARVLVNTMVYLNGKHFSLRSGSEHRSLRYKASQITLCEPAGKRAYLRYKEDISKTCQGGLKHRKITPKEVIHHASECKERCHVELYRKYMSLCPTDGRDDMFYLTPLRHPKETCWYSRQPIGHNTLQKVVPELCRKAGITGHKTNHSLRVTTATKLYEKGVPEQLIMERTGHRSVEGKFYKQYFYMLN